MRKSETSEHLVRVVRAMRASGDWLSAEEIGAKANVAKRTARAHATRLVQEGAAEVAIVFPGHRYRLSAAPSAAGRKFIRRVDAAAAAFGCAR